MFSFGFVAFYRIVKEVLIMKCNIYYLGKKKAAGRIKRLNANNRISVDQPFGYKEVVAITGSEYVRCLYSDGVTLIPYEELRRNSIAIT